MPFDKNAIKVGVLIISIILFLMINFSFAFK